MEKYDPNRPCVKCGYIGTRDMYYTKAITYPEHIDRICIGCRFRWLELPLDSKEVDAV